MSPRRSSPGRQILQSRTRRVAGRARDDWHRLVVQQGVSGSGEVYDVFVFVRLDGARSNPSIPENTVEVQKTVRNASEHGCEESPARGLRQRASWATVWSWESSCP